jgi:hypothetical protein
MSSASAIAIIGNCHHRHAIIGKACHRQGMGRKDARHRHAVKASSASACHRQLPSASACHRQGIGIIGIIIGIGKACHHRHRHHRQGIGMPSACHHRQQQDAGRQETAQWCSIVI